MPNQRGQRKKSEGRGHEKSSDAHPGLVSFVTWNILAQAYAFSSYFPGYDKRTINFTRRKKLMMRRLPWLSADVLCLQEVDHFQTVESVLKECGYDGAYCQRNGEKRDGCAIFWKTDKFEILEHAKLYLDDLSHSHCNCRETEEECTGSDKAYETHNVAHLAILQPVGSHPGVACKHLVVANTHIFWDPFFPMVKLRQVDYILSRLRQSVESWEDARVILCGDFNSFPGTLPYSYIGSGSVEATYPLNSLPEEWFRLPDRHIGLCWVVPRGREAMAIHLDLQTGTLSFCYCSEIDLDTLKSWAVSLTGIVEAHSYVLAFCCIGYFRWEWIHEAFGTSLPDAEIIKWPKMRQIWQPVVDKLPEDFCPSSELIRMQLGSWWADEVERNRVHAAVQHLHDCLEGRCKDEKMISRFVEVLVKGPSHDETVVLQKDDYPQDPIEISLSHSLKLQSAHHLVHGEEPSSTNKRPGFSECLDYIWVGPGVVTVMAEVIGPQNTDLLPTLDWPSDHLAVRARVQFN